MSRLTLLTVLIFFAQNFAQQVTHAVVIVSYGRRGEDGVFTVRNGITVVLSIPANVDLGSSESIANGAYALAACARSRVSMDHGSWRRSNSRSVYGWCRILSLLCSLVEGLCNRLQELDHSRNVDIRRRVNNIAFGGSGERRRVGYSHNA